MAVISWIGFGGYALFSPASIAVSQLFYGLGLAGFIGFLITHRKWNEIIFAPTGLILVIIAFVLYRLASMVLAKTDVGQIQEDWLFLMALAGSVMFREIKNLNRVLDLLAVGILIMGGYGIWQHFVGVDLYHGVLLEKMVFGYRAIGNYSTYLTFSGFFSVAAIFMVAVAFYSPSRWRRIFYLIASQVSLIAVLFNYSRSTIVALIIGIIILIVLVGRRYRNWIALVLLISLAIGMVISPDFLSRFKQMDQTELNVSYSNSRLAIWSATAMMIEDYPLFGVGPGNFHDRYIEYRASQTGRNLSHAHNDFLNTAAESGLPAVGLFLLLWIMVLLYLYKGYKACPEGAQKGMILGSLIASVVFLIMSQFEAFFFDEEVRLLLMFVWGVGMAVIGNLRASERLTERA